MMNTLLLIFPKAYNLHRYDAFVIFNQFITRIYQSSNGPLDIGNILYLLLLRHVISKIKCICSSEYNDRTSVFWDQQEKQRIVETNGSVVVMYLCKPPHLFPLHGGSSQGVTSVPAL